MTKLPSPITKAFLAALVGLYPLTAESKDLYDCQDLPVHTDFKFPIPIPSFSFCSERSNVASPSTATGSALNLGELVIQNPLVQSYAMQVKSSEYGLKSANGAWWPSVSMSNSSVLFTDIQSSQNYGGSPTTPSSPATAGTSFNPFNGSTTRDGGRGRSSGELTEWTKSYTNYTQAYPVIQIQWNFLNPTRYPQIAAAQHQLELSKSQLVQASQQTQSAIRSSFLQYLYWGYQVGEYKELLALQNQIVSEANERVRLKLLARPDASQQFRSLLNFQAQLESALQKQRSAAEQLDSLLSPLFASNDDGVTTSAPLFDVATLYRLLKPSLTTWRVDQEETIRNALQRSEALKQLLLQSDIAIDNANEQWGAILPTLGLLGYVTYQYTAGSQNYAPPTQPSGAASSTLGNYGGLSFSWNFFDGYATRNQAKSYQQQAKSYDAQYRQAATQLKVQALQLLGQLQSSKQLIELGLQDLRAAEEITADTTARARVGLEESYDVLSSKIDVREARLQLLQSIATYIQSFYQLADLVDPGAPDQWSAAAELSTH